MKTADLNATLSESIEKLAASTDAARQSSEWRAYLSTLSKFHKYSTGNIWLIAMQNPNATRIAGYTDWIKHHHRYVKKGEKGIAIFAPCPKKDTDEIFFKVVYVFDVAQTDGEPLPELPEWRTLIQSEELQDRLIQYANANGITVEIKMRDDNALGESRGGSIEITPDAGIFTLLHEIAHERAKHKERRKQGETSREQEELEAESIAFVVAHHFGIDAPFAANYLVGLKATAQTIKDATATIRTIAAEIITALEPKE
jgi:hypothetical protein